MKIVIFGDRKINKMETLLEALEHFAIDIAAIKEIVCGKATGADTLGEEFGNANNIKVTFFEPDWKDITVPGAKIKENKFGQYNANAAMDRDNRIVSYIDKCIVLDSSCSSFLLDRIRKSNKDVLEYKKANSSNDNPDRIPF